jgi:hypothetical protein
MMGDVARSLPLGDAQLLLRVWVEQHDATLRGRLVLPALDGHTTARGVDELSALVRRVLVELEGELSRR